MKKLIVLGIVATMVMGLAVAASAIQTDWAVQLRAANASNQAMSALTVGTKAAFHDEYTTVGSEDAAYPSPTDGYGFIYSSIDGQTASKDYRAPVTAANVGRAGAKVWTLVVQIAGGSGPANVTAWSPNTLKLTDEALNIELWKAGDLDVANNPIGGAAALWVVARGVSGSSALPNAGPVAFSGQLKLLAYTPGAPPPIPEPGSIVALMSGLVGLVGYGIRRRK